MPDPIIANTMSGDIISGLQTRFGSVDYSSFQSVRAQYYSYVTYNTAGVTQLNFFGSTAGQPGITLQDTNIPKTGSFGQQHFLIKSIGTHIKFKNTDDLTAFDGTDASTIASDMLFGFVNAGFLRFSIAARDFLQLPKPFQYAPPLAGNTLVNVSGITGLTAPLTAAAGTLTSDTPYVTQTIDRANCFRLDPNILVEAEQQFSVTIEFPTGSVPVIATGIFNDSTNPLKIGVWLDGVILRPMQ
jgi:hypothetical protein